MSTEAENTQTTEATPAALVNPDGTFAADWHSRLPDDLGKEESLKPFTSVAGLAKAYRDTKKMVGGDKVPVPTEKSPPEVWDAYYAAGGRPKTADDYKVEVPEDMAEFYTEDRIKSAKQFAHKIGVSEKQFQEWLRYDMDQARALLAEGEAAEEAAKLAAEETLRKEFGGAYDERLHVSNRLVEEAFAGKQEDKMAFLEKFGNDPDFIRFTSVVGARLVESKALVAQLTTNTPVEAKEKIKTIETKLYSRQDLPDSERESLQKELTQLYKVAYPEQQPGKTKVEAYSAVR